jgi:hypothetical protein
VVDAVACGVADFEQGDGRDPDETALDSREPLVVGDRGSFEVLGGAVDADDLAASAFGDPEPFTQHADGVALAVRGQKFPSVRSLSIDVSMLGLGEKVLQSGVLRLEFLQR